MSGKTGPLGRPEGRAEAKAEAKAEARAEASGAAAGGRADRAVTTARHWPGMRSEYNWLPPHDHVTVTQPYQIGVSFTEHHGVVHERDGRTVEMDVTPGDVFATGRQRVTWANVREPTEALEIYPDLELLRAAAAASSSQARTIEIDPVSCGRDPVVLGISAVLKRVHVHDGHLDELHASALAHRLAEHLVTYYCGPRPAARRPPGRLDRALLERVARLVDDRLAEQLTLGDLAAAAGFSPFHFARAFKASTGMAPYEYVIMRRVERAKTMLLGTGRTVAEVANDVGFSNLSHFRRTFHRHTGFSPGELRRR
jgi:AraC family transcriptional regulator